jgi:hypothetical protein
MTTPSKASEPSGVIRRYPASYLSDVVYGLQPMTSEIAEVIRTLRRDHGVDYARLGFYLCESDPDRGGSFGLGKALTELAAIHLKDHDRAWI